jgi:cation:H+ antiporter
MPFIFIIGGFYLLIQGADKLIRGATSLGKRLKISDMAIGLTVVAFGTSLPELTVNVFGSFSGNTGIVLGNIVGSNIANIFLILGISAMIRPLMVTHQTVWKEIPMGFLAGVVLSAMVSDRLLSGHEFSMLDRVDGIVLLCFFAIFLSYVFSMIKTTGFPEGELSDTLPLNRTIIEIILGLVGLVLGGKLVVSGAVDVAQLFGLSETVIGLTIVAIGTSLPELITSSVAAYRGNANIAVGNIIGSNIFNVFFVLGISALIAPIPIGTVSFLDEGMLLLSGALLFAIMFIGKRFELERWQGGIMVALYVLYLILLLTRETL